MSVLKNPKHELFAQELAKGTSQANAYKLAGYKPSEPNASRLTSNDKVQNRVSDLQSKAAARVVVTVQDIARQLDEDRTFAQEQGHSSAAVAASMGKAKILGLIVDRVGGPDGGAIHHDVALSARSAKDILFEKINAMRGRSDRAPADLEAVLLSRGD